MPTLVSLTPDDATTFVQGNTPVVARIQGPSGAAKNYQKTETTQSDFASGALVNVTAAETNDLRLAKGMPVDISDDFESYSTGSLPSAWWSWTGQGTWTVESFDGSKCMYSAGTANDRMVALKACKPLLFDAVFDFYMVDDLQETAGFFYHVRPTSAFGTHNGHLVYYNKSANELRFGKWTNGSWNQDGSVSKTLSVDTWYRMRVRREAYKLKVKVWLRTSSEPSSWDINDGSAYEYIHTEGHCGLFTGGTTTTYFDNVTILQALEKQESFYLTQSGRPRYWKGVTGTFDTTRWYGYQDSGCWWLRNTYATIEDNIIVHEAWGQFASFDAEVLLRYQNSQCEPGVGFRVRDSSPAHGYFAHLDHPNQKLKLVKASEGTFSTVAEVSVSIGTGYWYWLRVQAIGSALKVKLWNIANDEPSSWNIETTEGTHSSGYLGLRKYDTGEMRVWYIRMRDQWAEPCWGMDGSGTYIDMSNPAALKPNNVSVECWMRKPSWTSATEAMVAWEPQYGYQLYWNGSNIYAGVRGATSGWTTTPGYAADRDKWIHVAMTYDGSTIKFYVNGSEIVGQQTSCTGNITYSSGNLNVGRRNDNTAYGQGGIADLRVWDDVRTGQEIADNYQERLAGNESNLAGYWKLNERTYTVASDSTSGANNGTCVNAAWWTNVGPYLDLLSPDDYQPTGNRTSSTYDISTLVAKLGTIYVSWDQTLASGTSTQIEVKFGSGSFVTCTNGARLTSGFTEGDTATTLQLKETLSTSNPANTPIVSEVRVLFLPHDPALVKVRIADIDYTVANGGLTLSNHIDDSDDDLFDYRDVYYTTQVLWRCGAEHFKSITADVRYDASSLHSHTFTLGTQEYGGFGNGHYAITTPSLAMANAYYFLTELPGVLYRFNAHWIIAEPVRGMFDGYYWMAYVLAFDIPAAGIVGEPHLSEIPAAGTIEGWARGETPAAGTVQGWLRPDWPAAGVVGVPFMADALPVAGIVAVPFANDIPAGAIVYQVNLRSGIEIKTITQDTADMLDALGITVT